MTHLDAVQARFPDNKVLGMLDSPLYMDAEALFSYLTSLKSRMKDAHANFNTTGVIPDDCSQLYKDNEWRCLFGQYRVPLIKTKFVLFADQYDSY